MSKTVDFVTFCCKKDKDKLHENFKSQVESHDYEFDNIHLIYQRCSEGTVMDGNWFQRHFIEDEDVDDILTRNGINPVNEQAEEMTHGSSAPHYWRWHTINHLLAMEKSTADYLVFSDSDCTMSDEHGNPAKINWIDEAIKILEEEPNVLVVSPSDGDVRVSKGQIMSQQLFIANRERLQSIDFDLPFEGFIEGGPFQEYYWLMEGRIGAYMRKHNLWRKKLGKGFRYWHFQW